MTGILAFYSTRKRIIFFRAGEQHSNRELGHQRSAPLHHGQSGHACGDHVQALARSKGAMGVPAFWNDPRLRHVHLDADHHRHRHRQVRGVP